MTAAHRGTRTGEWSACSDRRLQQQSGTDSGLDVRADHAAQDRLEIDEHQTRTLTSYEELL